MLKKSYEYSNESGGNYSLFSGVYAYLWKEAIINESIPPSEGIKRLMEKQKKADLSFKWRFEKNTICKYTINTIKGNSNNRNSEQGTGLLKEQQNKLENL